MYQDADLRIPHLTQSSIRRLAGDTEHDDDQDEDATGEDADGFPKECECLRFLSIDIEASWFIDKEISHDCC